MAPEEKPELAKILDHIERPLLPWRTGSLTECGKNSEDVGQVISRDDMIVKIRKQGQQRAAMSSCMTCWNTAQWNRDWAKSPTEVMARDVKRGYGPVSQRTDTLLDRELRAIAALIEAHRAEFDGFLAGLGETENLDERRRGKRKLKPVGTRTERPL